MGLKVHGDNLRIHPQPGRELVTRDDFTIVGTVVFIGPIELEATIPPLYSPHPDNPFVFMIARRRKKLRAGKVQVVGEYLGLAVDPTPRVVSYPGGSGREPIETHPDFSSFGGNPDNPENGATFADEEENNEFVGFTDPAFPDFYGVTSYIVATPLVNLTYWSYSRPNTRRIGRTVAWPSGVVKPSNVSGALLIGMPYREIGNILYQVTEQILGGGPNGYNPAIYD